MTTNELTTPLPLPVIPEIEPAQPGKAVLAETALGSLPALALLDTTPFEDYAHACEERARAYADLEQSKSGTERRQLIAALGLACAIDVLDAHKERVHKHYFRWFEKPLT